MDGTFYYADDLDISGVITTFGRLEISDAVAHAYEALIHLENTRRRPCVGILIPTQLPRTSITGGRFMSGGITFLSDFWERGEKSNSNEARIYGSSTKPHRYCFCMVLGHFSPEEAGPELPTLLNKFIAGQLDQLTLQEMPIGIDLTNKITTQGFKR
ncbi:MAG: hypothetical protein CM15mP125_3940 [Gammaproteobacteria bacterium]|nr:MAG: hypothetical protein CM15mP125_3940 [Gammaproteobacteria bacterium]